MRILIADDHALFRDGLRSLLEARGMDVVGEASNGREAVELSRSLAPDVVLMDLTMPVMDGLAATRIISAELPSVIVVVLTASEDDADLFEAIKSGAQGFLPKDLEAAQLFEHLSGVSRGEPALTAGLARKLLGEFAHPSTSRDEDYARALDRSGAGSSRASRAGHHIEPRSGGASVRQRKHGQISSTKHPR